ncbi:MAG: Ubiquinone biosynthesis O-methyltransferase [candidate division BRC1 bacterium ADurb.BinA364]|nr:MAG: Ubiquinone biosynthesis O-methyltransferase [candidate division BRC1 bacterium ADurb.BinA364]
MDTAQIARSEALLREISEKYDAGPLFSDAYLSYWEANVAGAVTDLEQVQSLSDPKPVWFEYAFSSIRRGREFFESMKPRLAPDAKRFLDIGCHYGGELNAFAREGFDVVGLDYDPLFIALSERNAADAGAENVTRPLETLESDPESLGAFDFIACRNRLDRLGDVERTIRTLAGMLNPGGALLLQAANRDSLRWIASDPRHNQFGLMLLGPEDARQYLKTLLPAAASEAYSTFSRSRYYQMLEAADKAMRIERLALHPVEEIDACGELAYKAMGAFERFAESKAGLLPAYLRIKLSVAFRQHIAGAMEDLARVARGDYSSQDFQYKYLANYWTLFARKPADA